MKPPRTIIITTLGLLFFCFGLAQNNTKPFDTRIYTPKTTTIHYRIGETLLPIKVFQYGEILDVVYINLHDDEQSSVQAARNLLQREGGLLIKFENNQNRNIRFRLKGKYYTFDPNRMFSRAGATQSLKEFKRISKEAVYEVEKLGQRITQFIPDNPSCVIALHNNTEGRFGVNSYGLGSPLSANAKKVFENPKEDPDDIFFTTDSILYQRLSKKQYNTIWQDNENAKRDGSLSIYCGERNIRYVNCETQHGKSEQYLTMLLELGQHIEKINPGAIACNFRFHSTPGKMIRPEQEIYFGDQLIGQLKSVYRDDSTTISGRMEINKKFVLYSNIDFYLVEKTQSDTPRIEARIDPTREKKLLDAANTIFAILPIQ